MKHIFLFQFSFRLFSCRIKMGTSLHNAVEINILLHSDFLPLPLLLLLSLLLSLTHIHTYTHTNFLCLSVGRPVSLLSIFNYLSVNIYLRYLSTCLPINILSLTLSLYLCLPFFVFLHLALLCFILLKFFLTLFLCVTYCLLHFHNVKEMQKADNAF